MPLCAEKLGNIALRSLEPNIIGINSDVVKGSRLTRDRGVGSIESVLKGELYLGERVVV